MFCITDQQTAPSNVQMNFFLQLRNHRFRQHPRLVMLEQTQYLIWKQLETPTLTLVKRMMTSQRLCGLA